jgi:hypothetical protein
VESVNRISLCAVLAGLVLSASGQTFAVEPVGAPADSRFKFSTPMGPGVAVPDKIESSIGTLNLRYGYPKADTVEKIYDNLDRSRALQAYLMAIPIVNQAGMRDSLASSGRTTRLMSSGKTSSMPVRWNSRRTTTPSTTSSGSTRRKVRWLWRFRPRSWAA